MLPKMLPYTSGIRGFFLQNYTSYKLYCHRLEERVVKTQTLASENSRSQLHTSLPTEKVGEKEEKKKEASLITAAVFWAQRGPERSIRDICISLGSSKWNKGPERVRLCRQQRCVRV